MTAEMQEKLQPLRMFWHVVMHILVGGVYLYAQPTWREALICLVPFAVLVVVLDGSRMFIPRWNVWCVKHYAGFIRPSEHRSLAAITWTSVSMCLVIWWLGYYGYSREIAAGAIMFAGLIDPAARFCGVLWGKIKILDLGKTWVGLAGGVIVGVLLAWGLSVHSAYVAAKLTFGVLSAGALSASAVELFSGRLDNLLIPLGSAGAMVLVV